MKRLYQQIYLTIIAGLVRVVLGAGSVWRLGGDRMPVAQAFEMAGELAAAALPRADAPQAAQQAAVERLARRLQIDLALFDARMRPIARFGEPLPPPPRRFQTGGWLMGPRGPAWSFHLPDRRWIVARAPIHHANPAVGLLLVLRGIAPAGAVAPHPVVRR